MLRYSRSKSKQSFTSFLAYEWDPKLRQDTCHGNSPRSATVPPTILPLIPEPSTPTGVRLTGCNLAFKFLGKGLKAPGKGEWIFAALATAHNSVKARIDLILNRPWWRLIKRYLGDKSIRKSQKCFILFENDSKCRIWIFSILCIFHQKLAKLDHFWHF